MISYSMDLYVVCFVPIDFFIYLLVLPLTLVDGKFTHA